jgi:hypothetical protein
LCFAKKKKRKKKEETDAKRLPLLVFVFAKK